MSGRGHSLGLFPLQCQFALELMIFQGSCIGLFFQENATTKDTAQIYKPGIFRNYVSFQSGLVNIGLIIMVFLIIMQVVASITSGLRVIGQRRLLCVRGSRGTLQCVSPATLRTDCPRYAHCKAMGLVLDSRDTGSSQGFLTQASLTEIIVSVFNLQSQPSGPCRLDPRSLQMWASKKQAHTESEDLRTSGVASTLAPENLAI